MDCTLEGRGGAQGTAAAAPAPAADTQGCLPHAPEVWDDKVAVARTAAVPHTLPVGGGLVPFMLGGGTRGALVRQQALVVAHDGERRGV